MLNLILIILVLTFVLVAISTVGMTIFLIMTFKFIKSGVLMELIVSSVKTKLNCDKKDVNIPVGIGNIEDGKPTEYTPHSSKVDKGQQAISCRLRSNVEEDFNQERFAHLVSKKSETAVPFGEENPD